MSNLFNNLTKIQQILVTVIIAIIIFVGSATVSYSVFSSKAGGSVALNSSVPSASGGGGENSSEPKTEECPLNGSMHTKEAKAAWDTKRPLAVMIENHTDARPQSGLSSADVVYEAVAEGGITRFMAVFYCASALSDIQVGPVRSARTYFLDWLSEYDALYAHVGGANTPGPADALGQIITYGIKDMNQFSIGFPTYWRDYQRLGHPVATEHTMYSTTQKLWTVGAQRGWTITDQKGVRWDANFVKWPFKDDNPGGGVAKITVPFWSSQSDYTVEWDYDKTCNCYHRKNAGVDHKDLDNGQILSPKVVVVQFEQETHANDGYENNVHLLYATNGQKGASSGQAKIFEDGQVIVGKWNKATRLTRETFTDASGKPIAFDRGQIWIQTVPEGSTVTY